MAMAQILTFLVECKEPKVCTILLRGASKDILSEVERNLQDVMSVARNIMIDPYLCCGRGASEIAVAQPSPSPAFTSVPILQSPCALEVIPKVLIQNCSASTIRTITELRAKHTQGQNGTWGIDGQTGNLVDMAEFGFGSLCLSNCRSTKRQLRRLSCCI